jgi:hypothetical protein
MMARLLKLTPLSALSMDGVRPIMSEKYRSAADLTPINIKSAALAFSDVIKP